MREEMKDYHRKILDQFKMFNDTYRMVALNTMSNSGGGVAGGYGGNGLRGNDDDEYEEVEELIEDDNSDYEEGIIQEDGEFEEMHVPKQDLIMQSID